MKYRSFSEKEPDYVFVENAAFELLEKQGFENEFDLSCFDARRLVIKNTVIGKYESFAPKGIKAGSIGLPEGMTLKSGECNVILYDETRSDIRRRNWTICHEAGHVVLGHTLDGTRERIQADMFAAGFLMPEPFIRFLDCSFGRPLNERELCCYFNVSTAAARRRRAELECRAPLTISGSAELILKLYGRVGVPGGAGRI